MRGRSTVAAAAIVAVAALAHAAAPPPIREFDSAREALRAVLAEKPRVIAFGEYHQKNDSAKVPSSIKRFTDELMDELAHAASDLVVETWITEGKCGGEEKTVVQNVEKTTERPKETESEVVTLLKKAKAAGVQPHILTMTCDEYKSLNGKEGVDYEKMLGLIAGHLKAEIDKALARPGAPVEKMVLSYGGALHNDLYPIPGLEAYAFGGAVREEVKGRYLEVDLYVPEYIQSDKLITGQSWYPLYSKKANKKKVSLIKRGEHSYIIVFARS